MRDFAQLDEKCVLLCSLLSPKQTDLKPRLEFGISWQTALYPNSKSQENLFVVFDPVLSTGRRVVLCESIDDVSIRSLDSRRGKL